jgi:signal transduction histidine kinase
VAAIRAQCRDVSRRHAVAVEFICGQESIPVAPDLSLCLYRITQEALHNIAKHSHARRAQIRLELEPGAVCLDISDDGAGFDVAAGGEGLGLVSMRERANFAGGRFVVESDGTGTRIVVRVPLLGVSLGTSDAGERALC